MLYNTGGTGWGLLTCGDADFSEVAFGNNYGIAVGIFGRVCRASSSSWTTWSQVALPNAALDGAYFRDVAYANGSTFVAVGDDPNDGLVARTTDNGATWTRLISGNTSKFTGVAFNGTTGLIVGTQGRVLRSTNSGANWGTITFNTTADLADVTWRGSTAYILTRAGSAQVYRSTDGGLTWSLWGTLPSCGTWQDLVFSSDQVAWALGEPNCVARSGNGGQTWATQPVPTNQYLYDLHPFDDKNAVIVGSYGLVLRTRCGGSDSAVCTNGGNPCVTPTCAAATGTCGTTNLPSGTICSDNSACTKDDACNTSGTCVGTAITCDDGNVCTTNSCAPATGCVYTNVTNGTTCNDGNACTMNDVCTNGICGGTGVNCNDMNPCTTDTCNPMTMACMNTPVMNGTACNDGSACTVNDSCTQGVCGGQAVNCNDGNACTADSCLPAMGCVNAPTSAACSTGNQCQLNESCQPDTTCCGGTPRVCNDMNPCTADFCDPASGCDTSNVMAGVSCSDANACTQLDSCNGSGACVGAPINCDDGNPCTADSCSPASGCTHTPVMAGTSCSDGSACTTGDACTAGGACTGTPVTCNDNNVCTTDTCSPMTGCAFTPVMDNTMCDDGNACTMNDVCTGGACRGTGFVCDDNNPCTTDSCNPMMGNACVYTPLPVTTACSDGDACTLADSCALLPDAGIGCVGLPRDCSDNNECTDDTCAAGTCSSTPAATGTGCDDEQACTESDSCQPQPDGGAACIGSPKTCDDNNVCTVDSCNPTSGACVFTAGNEGGSCSDGESCTLSDSCQSGVCDGGVPCLLPNPPPCTAPMCIGSGMTGTCFLAPIPGCQPDGGMGGGGGGGDDAGMTGGGAGGGTGGSGGGGEDDAGTMGGGGGGMGGGGGDEADGGTGPGTIFKPGCACNGVDGGLVWGLLALALGFRRRRR